MKSCWREAGLTEEGARRADEALPHLLEGVRALSTGLDSTRTVESFSATLLREVVFRLCELPRLSEAEQRRYATKNQLLPPLPKYDAHDDAARPKLEETLSHDIRS